jgi:SOS-response transcriptional repressor LexA
MDFYYMGDMTPELNNVQQTTMLNDNGAQLPVVKIRFQLVNPVISSIYNYLQEKVKNKNKSNDTIDRIIPISESVNSKEELKNLIPLFNFYAAAGGFSEMQANKDFKYIEVDEKYSDKDYFACKVIGESMNRVIPNGSTCLFKIHKAGSRAGKVLLIENRNLQDPDFNSAFTVKTYSSEKTLFEEGWRHERILLMPNSFDDTYSNIVLSKDNSESMRVIGEFVKILKD